MDDWQKQLARNIAIVWSIKNNHPERYDKGQYEAYENDLYSLCRKNMDEILGYANIEYQKLNEKLKEE